MTPEEILETFEYYNGHLDGYYITDRLKSLIVKTVQNCQRKEAIEFAEWLDDIDPNDGITEYCRSIQSYYEIFNDKETKQH